MKVLTIVSNFFNQYFPDFSDHKVEYLLFAILIIVLVGGIFKR